MGDTAEPTLINGAVTCISKIIDAVVASAGEAEYGALFMVGREAASIRTILTDMGHLQPATPIKCDNMRRWNSKQHNEDEALQGHGHEISLDQG